MLNNKRNLKEWSRNASENVAILSATSIKYVKQSYLIVAVKLIDYNHRKRIPNRQAQCSNATNYKIGLTKLNLDNSYKILQLELEQYATTIREYDKAWQSYYVRKHLYFEASIIVPGKSVHHLIHYVGKVRGISISQGQEGGEGEI